MHVPRLFWLGAAILAQGCAAPAAIILEESVGPRVISGSKSGSGTLVVYTQLEPFSGDPDTPVRLAYVIQPRDQTVVDLTGEAFSGRSNPAAAGFDCPPETS